MKAPQVIYACSKCGAQYKKWIGRCEECNSWNSISQETYVTPSGLQQATLNKKSAIFGEGEAFVSINEPCQSESIRFSTTINELDRVLGGGIVKGSAILLGGDPGIGKSTILLQAASKLCASGVQCIYISAEESTEQVRLRGQRLGSMDSSLMISNIASVEEIIAAFTIGRKMHMPQVLIIDSIQTIYHQGIQSAPGTVSQVRACAFDLIRMAKSSGMSIILVGHVTKEGQLAGPKVLEHMVDTVLYFEGESGQQYRIIRAVKNRYGPANEIGIFEMCGDGLIEVNNPSALFLPTKGIKNSGACILPSMEGTRPMLLEVQALVIPSYIPAPRRSTTGWDANRLSMMIAVLNARYNLNLLDKEVYVNIAGGLKVAEPPADLAVIVALIAAASNAIVDPNTVFIGEVGLSGEVRSVSQIDARLQESLKLGFARAVIPKNAKVKDITGMELMRIGHILQLRDII